jgi:ribosome biogenesis ATPase
VEEVHTLLLMHVLLLLLLLQGDFDFAAIARRTPGFVGADLAALTKEAAAVAVSRIFTEIDAASRSAAQEQQQQLMDQQQQQQPLLLPAAAAADGADVPLQQQQQSLHLQIQPVASAAAAAAVAVCERMGGGPLTVSELSGLAISMSDFETALPKVQPSVRREGFTTKPDATWEDVGSLEEVG